MRLAYARLSLAGLLGSVPGVALAGPPELPEGDVAPSDTPPTTEDSAPGDVSAGPVEDSVRAPADADTEIDGLESSAQAEAAVDEETTSMLTASSAGEVDQDAVDTPTDDDPASVRGHREPLMPTNRGGIGLFYTTLPDAGGKYTFRFRVHTDFFRKKNFIYGTNGGDQQARVRGGIAIGFSPFEWGELFFSVNSSANRNARNQPGRQDAEAVFALGDIDFGIKGAYRFKNGIGLGGQVGLGLLSGSQRLLTSKVNFWFDALFAVDIRYLTKTHFPFRFTTNVGWMLDNSLLLADYTSITDPISREVSRFNLGGNHNRLRMRYAVDFPIRLGKERQFGLDPILEWAWDVSTTREPGFLQPNGRPSPLPRGSQWLTVGLRANVVAGLHIDAAADVGLVSPSFEYGPPVPPWQVILGLGWSFDPNPVVKEVPGEPVAAPTPPATLEGRVLGSVVDLQGNPVGEAKVRFPGLTSTAVVTDPNGNFTSFRFPDGPVTLEVVIGDKVVKEEQLQLADGNDQSVTIQVDTAGTAQTGVVNGTFVDGEGKPVKVRMHVTGQGVDEPFESTEGGLIALELYAGDYQATLAAAGFKDKTITFKVLETDEIELRETLERDAPPDTPNVRLRGKSIRLRKSIRYKGNALDPRSHPILDELAVFLKGHPEVAALTIGVHTDDRGAAQKRSRERAEAVRDYLQTQGVAPDRLNAKGYGASRPAAVNLTAAGRAKNNRTVFTVTRSGS